MAERLLRVGRCVVGQTHHTKVRDDVSLAGLLREAARRALDDAEMTWSDIDAVVIGTAPDTFEGVMMPELYLADALGRGRQADAARAHRGQRRRQHRDRGLEPHHRRGPQAGAHRRVREAVGGRHDLGARRRPQRQRRRGRLLRPAHPRLHRPLEGAGVRRVDGGGEGPQERAAEPVRPPEGPGHQPRDGEGVPDGVGPGAPPRVLPGVRRRLRDGADRRGRWRRRVEAGGLAARHLDAQRARPVPGPRSDQPEGGPGLRRRRLPPGRHHEPDRRRRHGRVLRAVQLVRADVDGEPRASPRWATAGSSPRRARPRSAASCR